MLNTGAYRGLIRASFLGSVGKVESPRVGVSAGRIWSSCKSAAILGLPTPPPMSLPYSPEYRVRTFGGLGVERSGVPLDDLSEQRKRLAILALLAATDDGMPRDKLLALLWPESDAEQSRNALNQLLYGLRRALGVDAILGNAELRLNEQLVTSDCGEFRRALRSRALEAAVHCYRGQFLDGFHIRNAPEFERWIDEAARRYAADHAATLDQLATRAAESGDNAGAIRCLTKLADAQPLSGRVAHRLMSALARNGQREAAIERGTLHISVIRADLGVEPDQSIIDLLATLRTDQAAATERPAAEDVVFASPSRVSRDTNSAGGKPAVGDARRRTRWGAIVAGAAFGVLAIASMIVERRKPDLPIAPQTSPITTPAAFSPAVVAPRVDTVRTTVSPKPPRVLIAALENRTGDSTYDAVGALTADWVTEGVQGTGLVTVVDPLAALALSRQHAADAPADRGLDRAAAMARDARADVVVWGAVYRKADSLVFRAQVTDVREGSVLTTLAPVTVPSARAIDGAEALRGRIAGALATLFDRRIASITLPSSRPPSYTAYLEYMTGLALFVQSRGGEARQHFVAAAQLDTSFMLPLVWIGFQADYGRDPRAFESVVSRMSARKEQLSPLDAAALQFLLARQRGDDMAATIAVRRAATLSPGSNWSYSAGARALKANQLREAIRWFDQVDPEHGWAQQWFSFWHDDITAHHLLGDHRTELALAQRAIAIGSFGIVVRVDEIHALIGLGRAAEARAKLDDILRTVTTMSPTPTTSPGEWMLDVAAEFREHRQSSDADSLLAEAVRWPTSADAEQWIHGAQDTVAARVTARRILGTALYEAGRLDSAKAVFTEDAVTHPSDYRIRSYLGLIAARQGDRETAERVVQSLESMPGLPSGRALRQGRILAILGDTARAMRCFETAVPTSPETAFTVIHAGRDWASVRSALMTAFNPNRGYRKASAPSSAQR